MEVVEASPDLINKLPEHLLCSIISYLPTKEAIATSIFSKHWKFLWKSLSRLSLNLPQDQVLVDKILSSQVGKNIEHFHMNHLPQDWSTSKNNMKRWINHLKNKKRLQGISLYCDKNNYRSYLPRSIFHGRFLQVVELKEYVLTDASPFEGCVNFKTLKLIAIHLKDKTLNDIVRNCTSLENLSLNDCSKLNIDIIHHKKLKIIEIRDIDIMKFTLVSESLTELVFEPNSCYSSKKSHIACPNLRVLRTNSKELLEWCTGLRPCRDYERYKYGIPLTEVRVLCTSLDLNNMNDNIVLNYIFRVWSHLQTLDITNQVGKTLDYESAFRLEYWFWEMKELADSFTHHLRLVRIRGFTGKEREIRLVTHMIKNACMLEKLEIQCSDGCSTQGAAATQGLLLLPRASINVSIVLNMPGD
ncbi:F-box/LRR-repeat protein At3g26922-like [Nicotiana tabacum]|uniref:F-box protein At1g80960-like n=1 Tax=Nicotiana tabacum TaxID=4097 RepID=A0A1S4B876_TOBAC|nr:PREDICTED: F-box protein At1g80960-like [Nicotiana tabacum]